MSNVKYFTNDKFRVIAYLYDARGADNIAHITQQEVADALQLSRVTINGIFKQLKEDKYLKQDLKHLSRYLLTEKAISAVEMFRTSNRR